MSKTTKAVGKIVERIPVVGDTQADETLIAAGEKPVSYTHLDVYKRQLVDDPRWNGYEVPPTSNANYGWLLNIVSKLSQNGVAGFLLANGALSDDGTELKIRQQLIENHLVEAIIILPRNLFYTTDISVTLWVLNKNKKARVVEQNGKLKRYRNREDEILFMDLRQMGSPYEKKYIELTEEDSCLLYTSVFKTVVYTNSADSFKYYEFTDAENVAEFDAYVAKCKDCLLYTSFYNNEKQTLYVKRNVGDSVAVAQCVAQELGHAQLSINSESYSRRDMGFQACLLYTASITSIGYGKKMPTRNRHSLCFVTFPRRRMTAHFPSITTSERS